MHSIFRSLPLTIATTALAFSLPGATIFGVTPGSGTVSPDAPSASWHGGPFLISSPTSDVGCPAADPTCDSFALTITPPDQGDYTVTITIDGKNEGDDYDLFVFAPSGSQASSSATASGDESVTLTNPPGGTYRVGVKPFLVQSGSTYAGSATLNTGVTLAPEMPLWNLVTHGACCEGNLAASGSSTYVLAPRLLTANDINRSDDGGQTWKKVYPPVNVSVPFGIEGDLRAFGNDIVYFGTELTHGVAARSNDRGDNFTVVQIPVAFAANDQAWLYMGPVNVNACPVQLAPYVLTGWYRIGSVALFSCDGGLTWPIQTPLVGLNGLGTAHVVCEQTARAPLAGVGDTRIANANFARMKAGRHGGWGPDGRFYWTEARDPNEQEGEPGELLICSTANFGATWSGIRHPLAKGTPTDFFVTTLAYDNKGTLYILHANKLYVSFNQGESFAFVHTLPRFGDDTGVADRAGQWFVVHNGTIHIALADRNDDGLREIRYLRGKHVDTEDPAWKDELVTTIDQVRLDFIQIAVDDNGIPTIGFTTSTGGTATASRRTPS